MSRTVAEEEKQIQVLVRRAEASNDRSGALRREALERLIALCSSEHVSLKIYAADHIRLFFSDFPDLEEEAINAIYDVCEDQSGNVRKQGYHAITQLSKVHNKCIKRNADVLLQLLQSDEQDEVAVVKKALIEHLNLNPEITLGVLCDQIGADSTDDEDASLRDKLRSLVIAFIDTAKATIRRHTAKDKVLENRLVDRLIASFTKMTPPELKIIVQGLLLSLPSLQSPSSPKGEALLRGLIERAKTALSSNDWDTIRTCLDLAAIVVDKSVAAPTDLLLFYYQTFAPKRVLEKLDAEKAALVLWRLSQTLVACDNNNNFKAESSDIRKKVIDASSIFFERLQVMSHSASVREQTINASKLVLQSCLHRRNSEGWQVPPHIKSAATSLGQSLAKSYSEHSKDVQDLIRSLVPNYHPTESKAKDLASSSSNRRIMKLPLTTTTTTTRGAKHSIEQDLSSPPTKRIKLGGSNSSGGGGGDSPSLLNRLGTSSLAPPLPQRALSSSSAVKLPDATVTQGFSIKGAAAKANSSSRTSEESDDVDMLHHDVSIRRPRIHSYSSLLSRLEGGGGGNAGKRRRSNT